MTRWLQVLLNHLLRTFYQTAVIRDAKKVGHSPSSRKGTGRVFTAHMWPPITHGGGLNRSVGHPAVPPLSTQAALMRSEEGGA